MAPIELTPVAHVESTLRDPAAAPKQGGEGAPDAWLVFDPAVAAALDGVAVGDRLILLSWLHKGERETLQVHPRDDPANPLRGVFATRSQDRPNPIGLHEVTVLDVEGTRLRVGPLEAIDGTPIVDVKPVI
ncbi:MAG TPA: tRNA (N6-threonylcarbamoyladenosine(37)-N6)-methyltransferase TrmO [Solirubrobacteraceae bacterium]